MSQSQRRRTGSRREVLAVHGVLVLLACVAVSLIALLGRMPVARSFMFVHPILGAVLAVWAGIGPRRHWRLSIALATALLVASAAAYWFHQIATHLGAPICAGCSTCCEGAAIFAVAYPLFAGAVVVVSAVVFALVFGGRVLLERRRLGGR